jgi:hypothetical protein
MGYSPDCLLFDFGVSPWVYLVYKMGGIMNSTEKLYINYWRRKSDLKWYQFKARRKLYRELEVEMTKRGYNYARKRNTKR